jgi:hypothetical protein
MVRLEVPQKNPNWEEVFEGDTTLKGKFVVNSFPELTTHQARMYVVAPYPKVPYFYR